MFEKPEAIGHIEIWNLCRLQTSTERFFLTY